MTTKAGQKSQFIMKDTTNIFLDLDGVCVDFNSSAIEVCGGNPQQIFSKWEKEYLGVFSPYSVMDISRDLFWKRISDVGEDFWVNLKPYPWFDDLYFRLKEIGHVTFLSATTYSPTCVSGKLKWLQARFGADFQDYIFTSKKHFLAKNNSFLIDDNESNVDSFLRHCGKSCLFPQIWNRESNNVNQINKWINSLIENIRRSKNIEI